MWTSATERKMRMQTAGWPGEAGEGFDVMDGADAPVGGAGHDVFGGGGGAGDRGRS